MSSILDDLKKLKKLTNEYKKSASKAQIEEADRYIKKVITQELEKTFANTFGDSAFSDCRVIVNSRINKGQLHVNFFVADSSGKPHYIWHILNGGRKGESYNGNTSDALYPIAVLKKAKGIVFPLLEYPRTQVQIYNEDSYVNPSLIKAPTFKRTPVQFKKGAAKNYKGATVMGHYSQGDKMPGIPRRYWYEKLMTIIKKKVIKQLEIYYEFEYGLHDNNAPKLIIKNVTIKNK